MLAQLICLILQAAMVPAAAAGDPLISEPVVLEFCRVMALKALSERQAEQSAFVIRTRDMLYFVAWPPSGDHDSARWYGRFPEGTVAILHTHPSWLPAPSNLDSRTARAARVPVYVITPSRISKTRGGLPEVVIEGGWMQQRAP